MSEKDRDKMVKENYEAFEKELPKLLKKHRHEFALMRDKKVVKIYPTFLAAWKAGGEIYEDRMYSVQEITDVPVSIYSHVA